MSQSSVPDVGVSCGDVHDPRYIVVGDSLGFAEQLILRVALEHDVERGHPLVSRVLFERNDDASDGQMRVTDSANLTPFFSSAVGAKMLRPRPGTTSARRLIGSWAPWLSRVVNEMMPVPTPSILCFPAVVISFGVKSSLNSRILSFSPGISSSSRNDSNAPLSTSSVAPLILEVNRLVAAAVNIKPPSKSLLLPSKLMTGFSLSGDSLSLAATVVSAVDLLFSVEQCAQLAHARETLAFLFGRVAPWL